MNPTKNASQQLNEFLKTSQGKTYTVTAVTVLLVLAIFIVGVFPAISSILLQMEDNQKRESALAAIHQKRTNLRNLFVELEQKEEIAAAFNKAFPTEFEQPDLIKSLYTMASSRNITITNTQFADLRRTEELLIQQSKYPLLSGKSISITAKGGVNELQAFIRDLESSKRIFNIRGIGISKDLGNSEGGGLLFNLTLNADTYFWLSELPT